MLKAICLLYDLCAHQIYFIIVFIIFTEYLFYLTNYKAPANSISFLAVHQLFNSIFILGFSYIQFRKTMSLILANMALLLLHIVQIQQVTENNRK